MDPRIAERAKSPRYSFREACALVGRPVNTVRRWSIGNQRRRGDEVVRDEPLIAIDGDREVGLPLSFLNLLELRMLSAYRDEAALPAIRSALEFAADKLGEPRPLLTLRFSTQGGKLFTEYAETADGKRMLLNASAGGQLAFPDLVRLVTAEIEYEHDVAQRWWYHSRRVPLLVDTSVAAGMPITAETGTRVDAIAFRLRDGSKPADIAEDTGATANEIDAVAQHQTAA